MNLFPIPPRDVDELAMSALSVIDFAFRSGATAMVPLLSGGHDSTCACHVAAQHPAFDGTVNFIKTGIGARANREHVESLCRELGWALRVWESPYTYERFVRERGFPGPGRHQWVYARLKDRCVRQMVRGRGKVALVTGCRLEESKRRMGSVEPVKVGERRKSGKVRDLNRVWTAPCHDWSAEEQTAYMNEFDLPRNPLKDRLGMSGECFCGAFASPGELDRVRHHAPDVAVEIDRLTAIARGCGTHAVWGTRPPKEKSGLLVVESGPLCSGCEHRARAAGLLFAS